MISVIITNYNKANYLIKTLKSCTEQLENNIEIIFFDDNSTDNSLDLVRSFVKKNKRLNFIILQRKGKKHLINNYNQISAVNCCLKYTSGKYIALLDADDLFLKNKFKVLNDIINTSKKKIIYNSYSILKNKKYYANTRHFLIRKTIWPIFPPTSCLTVEKKLFQYALKKISFKNYPTCWLDFRLAIYFSKYHFNEIIYLKKKLTIYRINEQGNDAIYKNIFSINYWKRKYEAFLLNIKI